MKNGGTWLQFPTAKFHFISAGFLCRMYSGCFLLKEGVLIGCQDETALFGVGNIHNTWTYRRYVWTIMVQSLESLWERLSHILTTEGATAEHFTAQGNVYFCNQGQCYKRLFPPCPDLTRTLTIGQVTMWDKA